MSLIVAYRPLFNISVLEAASGVAITAIRFAPTNRTERVLNDHQLVFRTREAGLTVYYRSNPSAADTLLGRITRRVQLSFLMRLARKDLLAAYEPDLTAESGPQLYLDNLTPSGNIQAASVETLTTGNSVQAVDAMKSVPPVFDARADGAGGPTQFDLAWKFDASTTVASFPAHGGVNQVSAKIDLSALPRGPYLLKTNAASATPRTVYVDEDVAGEPVLGIVDVHWETPQDAVAADGQDFVIRFKKR